MRLWQASGNWYIGPALKAGKMAGWWRCRDGARIPEQVKGCWEVGDGKEWHRAEHVRCSKLALALAPAPAPTPTLAPALASTLARRAAAAELVVVSRDGRR